MTANNIRWLGVPFEIQPKKAKRQNLREKLLFCWISNSYIWRYVLTCMIPNEVERISDRPISRHHFWTRANTYPLWYLRKVTVTDRIKKLTLILWIKWQSADDHFVKNDTKWPPINTKSIIVIIKNLWCQIFWSTTKCSCRSIWSV